MPTMSDEAVMVEGVGSLYLGGPPLVKVGVALYLGAQPSLRRRGSLYTPLVKGGVRGGAV